MHAETDDLLRPSLEDYEAPTERPWRLDSQFWVAFFGGPLAVAAISYRNAGRLRLSGRRRNAILWVAAAALAAEFLTVYLLVATDAASAIGEGRSVLRLTTQAAGVVAYPFLYRIQRPGDRIFSFGHEEEGYASLWGPGLVAVVVGGLLGVAVASVASSLGES